MVQVFHLSDDVVLKVENLKATTVAAKGIVDRLQLFLSLVVAAAGWREKGVSYRPNVWIDISYVVGAPIEQQYARLEIKKKWKGVNEPA